MLYSDGIHIISDISLKDLHNQMLKLGIKRCWFHNSKRFPHYDIPKRNREIFFENHPSVLKVTSRELIVILKKVQNP